ncbi:MAG TPA: hypothetical protein PKE05_04850 [Microthrixaceae bacterium]|nr:hypothetical protein [Microthrixaceae bacterium]
MNGSIDAAVIREQGVVFAVVAVKPHVLNEPEKRAAAVGELRAALGQPLIVLMSQDNRGKATFWGRSDLVRFLSRVPTSAMPWKRYRRAA